MRFTYGAYSNLLTLLKDNGYTFTNYHDYAKEDRCVILRHDIDTSLKQAVKLAQVESDAGVHSTWFVLLRTDFYNVASRQIQNQLKELQRCGHEIGLHFDEVAYGRELTAEETREKIVLECDILSRLLETPVTTVSMHRPSKTTLELNLAIPGIINSYGKTFFHDFKYLSDSRRRWREPVLDIICGGEYDRLHILTHAFWYHETEETIEQAVGNFIREANRDRYYQMKENITDLASILPEGAL